ncbi:hypothetical protein [Cupriavidus sp. H39]
MAHELTGKDDRTLPIPLVKTETGGVIVEALCDAIATRFVDIHP